MKHKTWSSPHATPLPRIGERTLVMGILNVTPDSFSDGGAWSGQEAAIQRARQMVADGADIIDIGGESTRPGARPVPADEETERTVPVIRGLRQALPSTPISIDTYKSEVAAAAIDAGADMINDVWGLKFQVAERAAKAPGDRPSSPMAQVAATKDCPIVIMHNRQSPRYADFWTDILADLRESLELARSAGIEDRQIWLDPGFGFGKEPPHNLEVVKHLDRIAGLGFPVLLGTSRKSTLGLVLDRPVNQRHVGTATTAVWGIARGCHMVRVHDITEIRPYLRMADAIRKGLGFRPDSTQ